MNLEKVADELRDEVTQVKHDKNTLERTMEFEMERSGTLCPLSFLPR